MAGHFVDKYKIVLIPFPYDDLSSNKVRPAVCLTDPIGPHGHIVLAFITSHAPENPLVSDLVITPEHSEFPDTGLRVSSTLQLHRLITLSASLIQRELGVLGQKLQQEVDARLRNLFALK